MIKIYHFNLLIGQCCIEKGDFRVLKSLQFCDKEFEDLVSENLKNYSKEKYARFDYSNFLLGPIIDSFCKKVVVKKENFLIERYDLDTAYLSVFANELVIPTTKTLVYLIGDDAQAFFDKIIINGNFNDFVWIKGARKHELITPNSRIRI